MLPQTSIKLRRTIPALLIVAIIFCFLYFVRARDSYSKIFYLFLIPVGVALPVRSVNPTASPGHDAVVFDTRCGCISTLCLMREGPCYCGCGAVSASLEHPTTVRSETVFLER